MSKLLAFERFDHGIAGPDLYWLRDIVRERWPAAEIGSSGAGEITLRVRTASLNQITIYAAPPGGHRRRTANTWRVHVYHGATVYPANCQAVLAEIVALIGSRPSAPATQGMTTEAKDGTIS